MSGEWLTQREPEPRPPSKDEGFPGSYEKAAELWAKYGSRDDAKPLIGRLWREWARQQPWWGFDE